MKLQYCSITGADDDVDIADLARTATQFPFVEWAVLLLQARAGQPRFPTSAWIQNFSECTMNGNKAMHLCDDAFLSFLAVKPEILEMMSGFQRIQLNLKFGDVAGKYDPYELVARIRERPQWQFILQYTPDNQNILSLLKDVPNHAILFDESAGRGITPDAWPSPLPGHACGYAGGLNPDNLDHNLKIISRIALEQVTWIDMETGVRTDDKFDLTKVVQVLKTAEPYSRTQTNPAQQ